jgi:hypothetical protein
VANHSVRDPVQPHQRLGSSGDIVAATPRSEERFGHGIVDEITRDAAAAEVPDRPVIAVVELGELGLFARATEGCGARQVTHDMSMPDCRHWLREICA